MIDRPLKRFTITRVQYIVNSLPVSAISAHTSILLALLTKLQ